MAVVRKTLVDVALVHGKPVLNRSQIMMYHNPQWIPEYAASLLGQLQHDEEAVVIGERGSYSWQFLDELHPSNKTSSTVDFKAGGYYAGADREAVLPLYSQSLFQNCCNFRDSFPAAASSYVQVEVSHDRRVWIITVLVDWQSNLSRSLFQAIPTVSEMLC